MTITAIDFASSLDACHERAAPGGVVASRNGWIVASGQRTIGEPVPGGAGMVLAASSAAPPDLDALPAFETALVQLQWDTLRTVLDDVVSWLGQRTFEGSGLLSRQLIQGTIAEVAMALSDSASLLDLPNSGGERLWQVHLTLVAAGRSLVKLYGAAGFVSDGPGSAVHLAELLGNVYLQPGTEAGHG